MQKAQVEPDLRAGFSLLSIPQPARRSGSTFPWTGFRGEHESVSWETAAVSLPALRSAAGQIGLGSIVGKET